MDENWPEFRDYVARARTKDDVLALPLHGARWHAARYAWPTGGFSRVKAATLTALARSVALRRAKDGPERRATELRWSRALAERMARTLTPDVTEVVVAQSLLPHLWADGHLGGRRFSVLMTRMPMAAIEKRLNAAAAVHPERRTLADFRADPALVAAETEALAAADAVITPHTEIAALFGARAVLLGWKRPPARRGDEGRAIAFVGPTIARKGAYELREAAKALDLEIVLLGSELEGPDFWRGVRTRRPDPANWMHGVAAVVQPALLEDAPRRLLAALRAGVPVIATRACGLPEQDGLTLVPPDDVEALIAILRELR
ncbi:MAG: glycosyltransferase family 4 protein [Alphaproteobacteria bacterium]|nr:glycosyltransferase family 4 protein [Alphaproteobacteria bacterium]